MSQNNSNSNNSNGHKSNGNGRHVYSDKRIAEVLAILASCGGNVSRASKETGVPRKTLESWSKGSVAKVGGEDVAKDMADLCQQKKTSLADAFEALAAKLVGVMTEDDRIKTARYGELNAAAGTAVDKAQLLNNKPTSIVGSDSQVAEKAIELYLKAFPGTSKDEAKQQIELASQRVM